MNTNEDPEKQLKISDAHKLSKNIRQKELSLALDESQQQEQEKEHENQELQRQKDILDKKYVTEEEIRPIPKKAIFTVIMLFIVGITLISIAGSDIGGEGVTHGTMDLSFVIMGSLLLIPAVFYGIKLIQVALSKDEHERQEILSEFPMEYDDY
ncbi:hypothetical protein PPERSA_02791 [Pseudocohnilembus persalinus]|uniref:Uncharacterized protein n=1 Tax=Pseudocohnilembus persalinus TaxID=266149 RepID=A0A0V0QMF5_PSEPJ|nr:hypothetical protein PPERSA_02791 [Pseudocohnilembus persalinus]|eukprot:KRX03412.1 hypothetical protein PPERSA_02791 [Pseudocohnilembus persalinus]